MKINKYHISFIFIFLTIVLFAQEGKIKKADKEFEDFSYVNAIEIYSKVAESGYKSVELFQNLADSYYFNSKYSEASKWYGELFSLTKNLEPIYFLRYSQSLKSVGENQKAQEYYDYFLSKISSGEVSLSASDYIDKIEENKDKYKLVSTTLNTNGVDFGGAIFNKNYFVFSSTRSIESNSKRKHEWNGLPFLDLYQASIDSLGNLGNVEEIKGDVNTKYHESTAVFTNDGKTMYFTRNNNTPDSRVNEIKLKIYRATLIDNKWGDVKELSISSDDYSTAHPALSPDNKKLYFVSNRDSSLGQTDIYVVSINDDGSLGEPINLGKIVNTQGRESFPYITKDNKLYFSSDGHYGLGGYDVFYVDLNQSELELLNVGEPINSSFDDVSFIIDTDTKIGFISSNREGGLGYDDIYRFKEKENIEISKTTLNITVIDEETKLPIEGANISISDLDNNIIVNALTDENGFYKTDLKIGEKYLIRVEDSAYNSKELFVETKEDEDLLFELVKRIQKVTIDDDLAAVLGIKTIYFDLDKSFIRPDAEVELQKVIQFLKLYPNVKIHIKSHTDSRADFNYNMMLSERRAKSTRQYIINNGISSDRLSASGWGESQLVNRCSSDVECTEEEHQQNRRSEFIIIER